MKFTLPLITSAALLLVSLLLTGCFLEPPIKPAVPTVPVTPTVSPVQRLAAVESNARGDDTELKIQPLRDPQVEDLREQAQVALLANELWDAANALNRAILIVPDDPGLLQERAEIALLQGDYERAETLSKRAYDLGSHVGPLCRRHWATIEQTRLALNQLENAHSAHAMITNCTIPGVLRM